MVLAASNCAASWRSVVVLPVPGSATTTTSGAISTAMGSLLMVNEGAVGSLYNRSVNSTELPDQIGARIWADKSALAAAWNFLKQSVDIGSRRRPRCRPP